MKVKDAEAMWNGRLVTEIPTAALTDKRLTTTGLRLLVLLGSYRRGQCYPSYLTLAAALGCDDATVYRNLRKLHTLGYLTHTRDFRANGANSSNHYQLATPTCTATQVAPTCTATQVAPTCTATQVGYLHSSEDTPTCTAMQVQCDGRDSIGFTPESSTKTGAAGDQKHRPPWFQEIDAIWSQSFHGPLFPHDDTERLITREIERLDKKLGAGKGTAAIIRRLKAYCDSFPTDDKRGRYGSIRHFIQCNGIYEDLEPAREEQVDRYAEDRKRATVVTGVPAEPGEPGAGEKLRSEREQKETAERERQAFYDRNAARAEAMRKQYMAERELERQKHTRAVILATKRREKERAREREELAQAAAAIRGSGT